MPDLRQPDPTPAERALAVGDFSAAAAGMALALSVYVLFTRTLHGAGKSVPNPLTPAARRRLPGLAGALLLGTGLLYLLTGLWHGWEVSAQAARINHVVFVLAVMASLYNFHAMRIQYEQHRSIAGGNRRAQRPVAPGCTAGAGFSVKEFA
ncbi:hypothetical protein Thiowin_00678 [Thiorhodovibrio winogradskyi]|uniref:DUF4234 domain-containing protein n=2 Tax=Thiorhodovibrio winogradskyi TaxID=77007 RepID=A0ABZ0S6H9_9GAMM